jgi:hypothetical protein
MSKQPLALASEAVAEQTGWRRGEDLIDSLPYIDGLETGEKEAVMRLVEEEVIRTCLFSFYNNHYNVEHETNNSLQINFTRQEIVIKNQLII